MAIPRHRSTRKLTVLLLIFLSLFTTSSVQAAKKIRTFPDTVHVSLNKPASQTPGILPFNGSYQISLGELDFLNRATYAHIQLRDQDEPKIQRKGLRFNPPGWHNYQLTDSKGKKAWLMDRGHLVGYQFSGLNDEPKNLVTMTKYLNTGFSDRNPLGMLYYENRLDSWLALHPNFWLDYKVTPIYQGDELVPRQVVLQYVGIDENGNLLQIKLGGNKERIDNYGITSVVLDNTSPLAELDYKTGMMLNPTQSEIPSDVETEELEEAA
ncbi:DNA/RNA non-specific endonuclease [Streptococcus phocae]|uniref:DNAse n=1 Tax=Streptococcus phocae TaxID=119224 RepID=A0A0N8FXF3_9STRE|nr:DNA/RNA non-specific endonuclease [Streptococcus phocae]KPJ22971.1 DNAse [Streptococcus phocae]